MSTTTVNDAVARPVRGAVQSVPAFAIIEFIDSFHGLSSRQYGAAVVLLSLLFSFVQTVVENKTGRAFLRSVPPESVPVVDDSTSSEPLRFPRGDAGAADAYGLVLIVVVVLVVLILVGRL